MAEGNKLDRRKFLRISAAAAGSAVLVACGGGAGSTPTTTTGGASPSPSAASPSPSTASPSPSAASPSPSAASPSPAASATPAASPAGSPTPAATQPTGGQTSGGGKALTVSAQLQSTWIRNFNPFSANNLWPTTNGIYEPMIIYNTVKQQVVPWLATKWEWSDDNKTLTFTVRDGVKWSDGQPFTAKDVEFTFNYMRQNKGLVGGGSGAWEYLSSVKALDEKTVQFKFKKLYTIGFYDIGGQVIVPEHIWKDVKDPAKFTNPNPVATGPFTQVKTFRNQVYELGKNPNYWQQGKPYIEVLRMPAYPGNDQANLATIKGEVDWAANFIPDIQRTFVAKDPQHFGYWFPALGADVMLYLNTTKKPFDDPNVRKAISMAINRDQIAKVAEYGYTHPADATGLSDAYSTWKSQEAIQKGDWVKYDPNKANQMLDAAGLRRGAGGIRTYQGRPLVYQLNVVAGWTDWVSACQIMAQNLKQVGFNVSVKSYDYNVWFDKVQKGDFDMSIGWSSGGPTPFNFYRGQMSRLSYQPIGTAAGENWHRYKNEQADKLLDQFAATSDINEQKKIAEQLQLLFVENAPSIPLFPGPMWYEYNTRRFTDFPNEKNPYAVGSTWMPEALIVLTTVKPE